GDIMGDVNSRRGRVAGMEQHGSLTVVKAQVPMSEMLTYEQSLTASTGARGAYKMAFSHYEEVPSHLQAKIIAASKAARGEEEEDEG
nr:elongation factor G [Vicinamibacterales bacterium]